MIRLIFVSICIAAVKLNSHGQIIDSSSFKSVKERVVQFFVKEGYFSGLHVDSLKGELFYASELVGKHPLRTEIPGIYWIGLFQSHAKEYIMVLEGNSLTFYRVEQIRELICNIFTYCRKYNIDDKIALEYIQKSIDFFKYRNSIKHSEINEH